MLDGLKPELDYHALNAMLNLYDADGRIRFDADRMAARQYFLQHVNQNTVFFHSLDEKLDYLVEERYYEPEVLDQYSKNFQRAIWDAAFKRKFRFPTFLGAFKYYTSYTLKTRDGQRYLERYEDRVVMVALALARGDEALAMRFMEEMLSGRFQPATPALLPELLRSFQPWSAAGDVFCAPTLADLAALLRRAASLSQALPNQAVSDYHAAVAQAVEAMPAEARGTEVERLVRQRVGQARYRDALLTYWGGACAVTGVAVTEALRASHAKPWAECADDAERLDAFNGFLLVANLDALFDRFLISFDDTGHLLTSTRLSQSGLPGLGIHSGMTLRWLASEHRHYLQWHRERFLLGA